jgi:enamine deaminase RidA (YjgF/YER057c/UK114 family)
LELSSTNSKPCCRLRHGRDHRFYRLCFWAYRQEAGKPWVGKLGLDMDTASGKAAARSIAIDLMATLQAHLGSLDRVKRIVKVMGLVNSTDLFTEQHLVVNGCSELLFDVFGEAGKHARSAFGVTQIPLGRLR